MPTTTALPRESRVGNHDSSGTAKVFLNARSVKMELDMDPVHLLDASKRVQFDLYISSDGVAWRHLMGALWVGSSTPAVDRHGNPVTPFVRATGSQLSRVRNKFYRATLRVQNSMSCGCVIRDD